MDVRIFHPDCPSNLSTAVPALYKRFQREKKRQYGQRVREVELGSFTPIVFSTTGGMGTEAQTFFRRLAGQLSVKKNMPFHLMMNPSVRDPAAVIADVLAGVQEPSPAKTELGARTSRRCLF